MGPDVHLLRELVQRRVKINRKQATQSARLLQQQCLGKALGHICCCGLIPITVDSADEMLQSADEKLVSGCWCISFWHSK